MKKNHSSSDKWAAYLMCVAGIVLLSVSLALPPQGVIDSSVLVAFGELLTFSGALLGIAYIRPRTK